MKTFFYKVSNKTALIWLVISLVIYLFFSHMTNDFVRFYPVLLVGMTPNVFIFFHGDKVE